MSKPLARLFTPVPLRPDFPDGFSTRWYYFARALAERFDLEIVAARGIWHGHIPDEQFKSPLPARSTLVLDARPSGWARKLWSTVAIAHQAPRLHGQDPARLAPPDLAVFFLHFLAPLAFRLPQSTRCVFALEEDVVSMHEANMAAASPARALEPTLRRLAGAMRRRHYGRLVRRCGERGLLVAISEEERARLSAWTSAERIRVVGNGLDPQAIAPIPVEPDFDIGVFGDLGAPRNYAPTRSLLRRAAARDDALRWLVVGRSPHPSLEALAGERVTVIGDVANIHQYYARARVVLVPARVVAGTKSTLLTAWALGRPVVATPASASGIPARDRNNLLLADGDDALLDAARSLLKDHETASRIASAGRRTLATECDLRARATEFVDLCGT